MEWNPETLQFLSQCFLNTLSPHAQPRRQAESALFEAAERPNYGLAVLRLVAEGSIDEQIRQSAAVNFKNHLKARWSPSPVSETNPIPLNPISDVEKESIKTLIVSLMLNASPKIQSQLSEALSVIGQHDFPRGWPSLLPEIVAHLDKSSQGNDYASINGLLATLNSLFMKFRYTFKTNDLLLDLKYCLDNFAKPLLEVFKRTANLIDQLVASGAANASTLKPYIESQKLCCSIFYSLNFQELPEFFEDHMSDWMVEFKKYLTVKYPSLEDHSVDGLALFELRAAVCDNITLYMVKEEELFQPYLSGFVEAIWSLLVSTSSNGWEQLTVTAIKFLTTVSKSGHHTLFSRDDILQQICQSIVIPNVMLQDEDEELFDMNPIEFIRRDMEGSDIDTRRRIACELLKGIAVNYKDKVAEKVTVQIRNCLDMFANDPKNNWKYKDCAIYLVVSLATRNAGGTLVSTDLVDVQSFFGAVIIPELQNQDVTSFPMLKAGALKFFTLFRNQIPKQIALTLLLDVTRFLTSMDYVVHSYAASCIEKLLLVKDDGLRARYSSADIGPILVMLMNNLFGALSNPESEENQYVMKCIMRVVCVADLTTDVASPCIEGLTTILGKVCQNPKNPLFNHYLFESIAALIRRACEKDISLLSLFETKLFPSLQIILARDISEFFPYAFQLLAELVDLNRPPLPEYYLQVFEILLLPDTWTRSANVPALVSLLKAFLQKAPHELNQQERLKHVIDIFYKLVSASSTVDQGFYVINTVIENLGFEVLSPHVRNIWAFLFHRLENKRTVKLVKNLIILMSLFLVKHGPQNLVNSINAVQHGIFQIILVQFWIPNLKLITGPIEFKLASVASTRLICEAPDMLDINLWGKMLDSIVTLLSQPEKARVDEEPEIPEFGETAGYNTAFARLYNAGKKDEDPLKELKDPRQFLVMSLSSLSAANQGKYPQVISANLDNVNQSALLQLCNSYSVSIV